MSIQNNNSPNWFESIIAEIKRRYRDLVLGGKLRPDIDTQAIAKAVVCGLYIIIAALMQTTVFARFNFFGAVPDLMLTSVIVISMYGGEKWGAGFGIFAGYLIDALASSGLALSPIVYMMFGCVCGILTKYYLKNSLPVWGVYMVAAAVGRGAVTLIYISGIFATYQIDEAFTKIIFPEMGSTVLFSFLTLACVRGIFRLFEIESLRSKKRKKK
jgi:hypothetical protein